MKVSPNLVSGSYSLSQALDFISCDNLYLTENFQFYEQFEDLFIQEKIGDFSGYLIETGKIPIMLSCPHSVSQVRNGNIKLSETRTALIAKLVKKCIDIPIILKTKNLGDDANFDAQSDYRDALAKYILENGIQCCFDLHICSSKRPFSFDIGTGKGQNIFDRQDLKNLIFAEFSQTSVTNFQYVAFDEKFSALNPNTVSAHIAALTGIPAFQIEINWNTISNYEDMLLVVNRFIRIIKKINYSLKKDISTYS